MKNQKRHQIAEIIIWKSKAFVPSKGFYKGGLRVSIEPVYIVNINAKDLATAVSKILSVEPIQLPQMSPEERKSLLETIPRITGARNWNQLYQEGFSYIIESSEKEITLLIPDNNPSGGWIFPKEKRKSFIIDTELSVVMEALLEDLNRRQ